MRGFPNNADDEVGEANLVSAFVGYLRRLRVTIVAAACGGQLRTTACTLEAGTTIHPTPSPQRNEGTWFIYDSRVAT